MTDENKANDGNPTNSPTESKAPVSWLFTVARWTCSAWQGITSKRASRLIAVLQLAVVISSALSIWYQLRQQASLTRAANSQALVNLVSPMNMELIRNAEIAELWLRHSKRADKMLEKNVVDEDRYETLLATYLIFYENMYIQHNKCLLDDDVYAGWANDLKAFVESQPLERYWDNEKDLYETTFSKYLSKLLEDKKAKQP